MMYFWGGDPLISYNHSSASCVGGRLRASITYFDIVRWLHFFGSCCFNWLISAGIRRILGCACLLFTFMALGGVREEWCFGDVFSSHCFLGIMIGNKCKNLWRYVWEVGSLWDRVAFLASFWALVTKELWGVLLLVIRLDWMAIGGL